MAWPTTNDPRTVFVTGRLTEPEAQDLDWLVAQRGTSRSEVLRTALDNEVAREKKAASRAGRRSNRSGGGS